MQDASFQAGHGWSRWLSRAVLLGSVALLLALVGVAAASAAASWRAPFPRLFLDPYGAFSNVGWFNWDLADLRLRYPNRLTAVDGVPLDLTDPLRARQAREHIARLLAEGHTSVALTFATEPSKSLTVRRPLDQVGASEIVFFFGLYALAGLFLLWTGMAVLRFAGRRHGARAYAVWTFFACAMMVTFFDYHTSTWLWPVFSVSAVGFNLCFLWVAYAFPEPPRRGRRLLQGVLIALTVGAVGVAAWLVVAPRLGKDALTMRALVNQGISLSMGTLVLAMALRVRNAQGRSRAELVSAFWGLAVVPAILGIGYALLLVLGYSTVHLLFPFAFPLIPAAIGLSLVRHNILGTDALPSRGLLIVPTLVISCAAGLLSWLFLSFLLRGDLPGWVAVALSAPVPLRVAVLLYRGMRRVISPADDQYRAVLEALSDHLAKQKDAELIRRSIEGAVTRWLPTESARIISLEEVPRVGRVPPDAVKRLTLGEPVWTDDTPWQRSLMVPLRSLAEVRGVLLLAPKHQAALYTTADLNLLASIASIGAVALHHAEVLAVVDMMRRREVEVTRDEKRFALGMVGAEISHEVTYSLNFFRYLLKRSGNGRPLESKDVEIGREEVGRLERMLAALRRFKPRSPVLKPVRIVEPVTRALEILREDLERKDIQVTVEVPAAVLLRTDADLAVQVFANLLRNAAQAVLPEGRLGVRWVPLKDGGRIELWDDGPGIPDGLGGSIWSPWVTGRAGGTGLGLTISLRIARSLGWSLELERRATETCFVMSIPKTALCEAA